MRGPAGIVRVADGNQLACAIGSRRETPHTRGNETLIPSGSTLDPRLGRTAEGRGD